MTSAQGYRCKSLFSQYGHLVYEAEVVADKHKAALEGLDGISQGIDLRDKAQQCSGLGHQYDTLSHANNPRPA
jgi:hypothetical protein